MNTGEALFLPYVGDLNMIRGMSIELLAHDAEITPYVICREEVFYQSEALQETLANWARMAGYASPGESDGRWRCTALRDMQTGMGVLLHRREGSVLSACLPVISPEEAKQLISLSEQLAELADQAEDIQIRTRSGQLCDLESMLRELALLVLR